MGIDLHPVDPCALAFFGKNRVYPGRGIPPDAIGRIFSPGYSSKPDGFGIGLALVEKIITLHEWAISVTSKPGEGAQFTITIPKRDILERIRTAA
jgi:signal transduction histidine kinase